MANLIMLLGIIICALFVTSLACLGFSKTCIPKSVQSLLLLFVNIEIWACILSLCVKLRSVSDLHFWYCVYCYFGVASIIWCYFTWDFEICKFPQFQLNEQIISWKKIVVFSVFLVVIIGQGYVQLQNIFGNHNQTPDFFSVYGTTSVAIAVALDIVLDRFIYRNRLHNCSAKSEKYVSEKDTKKKYLKAGLDSIGREQYNFDYAKEKIIYKYVCHEYIGRKELKTLKSDEKFLSYTEWEAYVKNKYKNSCINGLRNFSRFLNLKMKNKKPVYESLGICIPVLLTLVGDKSFLSDMQRFGDENVDWILPLITILISVFLGIFVYKLLEPIWNCNVDVNFLKDYKEIIDNMICEKNKFGENSMDFKV